MQVVLTVASGALEGRKIILRPGQVFKIGRTEWADFAVPRDTHMSGLHFSVRCDQEHCYLKDLRSTNGTLVNGQATSEATLQDGDTILAGRTQFRVHIEQRETAAAEAVNGIAPAASLPTGSAFAEGGESAPAASRKLAKTVEDVPFLIPPRVFAADSGRPFDEALQDEDPGVRSEALLAAAWTRQAWLLDYCRWQASQPIPPHWDAVWMLAVLGKPTDRDAVRRLGRNEQLGIRRFEILASFGHPRIVPDLLQAISSKDPETAIAAGIAFTKITGADIDSDEIVAVPAKEGPAPDESEPHPADEAVLPSVAIARQHWEE